MTSHWQFLTSGGDNQPNQNGQQQPTQWSYISLGDNSAPTAPGPYDYAHAGVQAAPQSFASYGQLANNFSGQQQQQQQQSQPNKPHQGSNYYMPQQAHQPVMTPSAAFQPNAYQDDVNATYNYNYNQQNSSASQYDAQAHQQHHYPVEPKQQQQQQPQHQQQEQQHHQQQDHQQQQQHHQQQQQQQHRQEQHHHQHDQQQYHQLQSDQFSYTSDNHHVQEPVAQSEEAPVFHEDLGDISQQVNEEANDHQAEAGGGWDSEAWNDSRRSSVQNDTDWTNQRQRSRTASSEPQPSATLPYSEETQHISAHPEISQMPTSNDQQAYAAPQHSAQSTAPQDEQWNDWDNSSIITSPQSAASQVTQPFDQTTKENGWDWDEKEDNGVADQSQEYNQQPTEPFAEHHAAPVEDHQQVNAESVDYFRAEERGQSEEPYRKDSLNSFDGRHGTTGAVNEHVEHVDHVGHVDHVEHNVRSDHNVHKDHNVHSDHNTHQSAQIPSNFDAAAVRRSVDLQQPLPPIDTQVDQNGDDDPVFADLAVKKQVTPESIADRLRRLSSTDHSKDCDVQSQEQPAPVEDTSVSVMIQNAQNSVASTSVKQADTVELSTVANFAEEPLKPVKTEAMASESKRDRRQADRPKKEAERRTEKQLEKGGNEPLLNPTTKTAHRTSGKESKSKKSNDKDSYHNRIRSVKQQYPELPEIIERLDKQRATTPHKLDWGTPPKVQSSSQHPPAGRKTSKNEESASEYVASNSYPRKNSTPKEISEKSASHDPRALDVSAIAPPRPRSNLRSGSVDMTSTDQQASFDWDEQGIDARRKARHRLRPPSRAESEFGDNTASRRRHSEYDRQYSYGGSRHAHPHPHAGGRYTPNLSYGGGAYGGGHSRHYSHYEARPRPHSAFDREAYERERSRMYEAGYRYEPDEEEDDDSESRSGDTGSESATEEELAEYEYKLSHEQQRRRPIPPHDPRDLYYFYVIRLPNDLITHGVRRYPPPRGYESLAPIEKAAYLYYFSLYRKYMSPVAFRKIFAYQYSRFMLPRDSTPEKALEMIVQWTRAEYDANVLARTTAAYTASQKQLFSDDRETPDSRDPGDAEVSDLTAPCVTHRQMSDRGSYNEVADSDRFSVESAPREPLKFRVPHAFARFGPGGRAIVVDPTQSIALVEIKDVKSLIVDADCRREIEILESFRGPLVAGQTPAHSVRLFVQRQLEKVRQAVSCADEEDEIDSHDCLLVWQLLDMVVQQQGRVTGPDLARLLTAGQREDWTKVDGGVTQRSVDPHAHARFTEFLLGGHIEEALDSAVRDGLFADALVMARRIFAGDAHRLDEIEAKFLSTRPIHNPVMTLLSVASNQPAPVLTNPPTDASGGWRPHAAIVLANLSSPTALNTVYHLGKALARRHRNYAADFCFLAVHLLAGWDVFTPIASSPEEDDSRQHISLIHATLPGQDNAWSARFKWSLVDLQATEVYDYAVKLANPTQLDVVGVQSSVALQLCKVEYATRLSEYGGFASDTFRYCVEVAKVVWARFAEFQSSDILRLCDLADSMHQVASADPGQTAWIESLRSSVAQQPTHSAQQESTTHIAHDSLANNESIVSRRQSAASSVIGSSHRPSVSIPPPIPEAIQADRQRLTSLSDEAASWHEDHQDPIEMHSQNDAGYPAPSFYVTDGHDGHRRASEISTASSIRPPNVGGHSAKFHQNPYEYSNYGNSDTGTGTETAESSPHHQQRYTPTPDAHATPQAYYTPAERARHRADPPIVPASPDSVFGSPNPPPPPQQHQQHHQQQQQHHQQQHQQQQQQHQQHQLPPVPAATPAAPPALSFSPSPDFDRRPSETPAGQSQHQPPTSAQLQPPPTAAPKTPASAPPDLKRSNSGQPPRVDSGSRIKKWLTNILPDKNAMKLPDDSSKSIYWDNNLKKWIGDGVADETPAQPPPVLDNQSAENLAMAASTQGLKAARRSGGSRYFNPLDSTSGGSVTDMPSPSAVLPPAPPVPSAYHGFIPTMPVENGHTDYGASEDYSSPFSSSDPFSYSDPSQQQAEMAK